MEELKRFRCPNCGKVLTTLCDDLVRNCSGCDVVLRDDKRLGEEEGVITSKLQETERDNKEVDFVRRELLFHTPNIRSNSGSSSTVENLTSGMNYRRAEYELMIESFNERRRYKKRFELEMGESIGNNRIEEYKRDRRIDILQSVGPCNYTMEGFRYSSYPNDGPFICNHTRESCYGLVDGIKNMNFNVRDSVESLEKDRVKIIRQLDELAGGSSGIDKEKFGVTNEENVHRSCSHLHEKWFQQDLPRVNGSCACPPYEHIPYLNRHNMDTNQYYDKNLRNPQIIGRTSHLDPIYHKVDPHCHNGYGKFQQIPSRILPDVFEKYEKPSSNCSLYHRHDLQQFNYQNAIHCHPPPTVTQTGGLDSLQHKSSPRKLVGRLCHPIGRGAPFLTCDDCLELVEVPLNLMPKKKKCKIRCGYCSNVILLVLKEHEFPVSASISLENDQKDPNRGTDPQPKEDLDSPSSNNKIASVNDTNDVPKEDLGSPCNNREMGFVNHTDDVPKSDDSLKEIDSVNSSHYFRQLNEPQKELVSTNYCDDLQPDLPSAFLLTDHKEQLINLGDSQRDKKQSSSPITSANSASSHEINIEKKTVAHDFTEFSEKDIPIPPRPQGSSLLQLFEYSEIMRKVHKDKKDKQSNQIHTMNIAEKKISSVDIEENNKPNNDISGYGEQYSEKSKQLVQEQVPEPATPSNGHSKQYSISAPTETDCSYEDYSASAISQDSWDVSRSVHSNEEAGASFSRITKNSPRSSARSTQNVFINGLYIPPHLVQRAAKKAGPILPGNYWYDYKAGFWGVMGYPCLGIVLPFIDEFNVPMPKDCSGGNTCVYVNGRELHERDLDLLCSRGLPPDRNKSYRIRISGKVYDENTKEQLHDLGRLAPSVEKKKRGFGMRVLRPLGEGVQLV